MLPPGCWSSNRGVPLQRRNYLHRSQACSHVRSVDSRPDRNCSHRNTGSGDCLHTESLCGQSAGGGRTVRSAGAGQQQRRFGHVLAVGGSLGKSGAIAMCGTAALRIGAGLATVACPASVLPTVAGFAAELMTEPLGDGTSRSAAPGDAAHCLELAKSRDVLAIGPGLSQRPGVAEFVHRLVKRRALSGRAGCRRT